MQQGDRAIARIDAARRARAVGQMLVTEGPDSCAEPERVLLDVSPLVGRELFRAYQERHAVYATAPFDPDGNLMRFYPGGVTIWSGFPGAGKTSLLRQTVCHLLRRDASVFLASLEEDPSDVLIRLAGTTVGCPEPDAEQMQDFIDAYGQRFRLWGVIGIAQHQQLLGVVRMLAGQGVQHAVIDSLMCLDVRNDDFEAQRKFANLLAATARVSKIHIHLVAHPRKLISSDQEPDLNDVAGAREIGGIADNVIFVRRGGKREEYGADADVTPMCIAIRKQRHYNGTLCDVNGWYQRRWRQFSREQFPVGPLHYMPSDSVEEPRW